MGEERSTKPLNLLARGMKVVGHLTAQESRSGKVFKRVEKKGTDLMGRLATNESYLHGVGRLMGYAFRYQAQVNTNLERMLHSWRLPTSTDVYDMRSELRRMHDQVEAVSVQLESLYDRLEQTQLLQTRLADAQNGRAA